MATAKAVTATEGRDLVLTREIAAAPAAVYRAWTEPELLMKWFAPLPWTTARAEMDVRPGGASLIVMRSPEGAEFPSPGQFLEVVPGERLVFTNAYTGDWVPSQKPFMTVVVTFEGLDGGARTKYTARVRHWTVEDREQHEAMGFHQGWVVCAEQLAEMVEK